MLSFSQKLSRSAHVAALCWSRCIQLHHHLFAKKHAQREEQIALYQVRHCWYTALTVAVEIKKRKKAVRSPIAEAAKTQIQAFVSCSLDYCNSLFYGASWRHHSEAIQSIQNAAARPITGARPRDHITYVLRQLKTFLFGIKWPTAPRDCVFICALEVLLLTYLLTNPLGSKGRLVRVWVAGETVWTSCYTRVISERFRYIHYNALYKFIYLYLLLLIAYISNSKPIIGSSRGCKALLKLLLLQRYPSIHAGFVQKHNSQKAVRKTSIIIAFIFLKFLTLKIF